MALPGLDTRPQKPQISRGPQWLGPPSHHVAETPAPGLPATQAERWGGAHGAAGIRAGPAEGRRASRERRRAGEGREAEPQRPSAHGELGTHKAMTHMPWAALPGGGGAATEVGDLVPPSEP